MYLLSPPITPILGKIHEINQILFVPYRLFSSPFSPPISSTIHSCILFQYFNMNAKEYIQSRDTGTKQSVEFVHLGLSCNRCLFYIGFAISEIYQLENGDTTGDMTVDACLLRTLPGNFYEILTGSDKSFTLLGHQKNWKKRQCRPQSKVMCHSAKKVFQEYLKLTECHFISKPCKN